MAEGTIPTLLFVVGPPAVGKMTVGQEITKRTGLRLFHNHLSAEPVLPFFDFGSPAFDRLVDRFRRHLIEEVAASDLPGLIFTYVWAYDLQGEQETLERYARPFRQRGGRVLYAELQASQEERLNRNAGASRLAAKPSKRKIEASRRHLLEADARYRLDSAGRDSRIWRSSALAPVRAKSAGSPCSVHSRCNRSPQKYREWPSMSSIAPIL